MSQLSKVEVGELVGVEVRIFGVEEILELMEVDRGAEATMDANVCSFGGVEDGSALVGVEDSVRTE
jgi:hypothetical protein